MAPSSAGSKMTVPLLDLKAQYASIRKEVDEAVRGVIDSARFIGGPEITALEEEIARYSQCAHAVGVASGTDALILAIRALGVGYGDEVIVPTYSFIATAGAVVNCGAKPVFVDVDPATYNIDPKAMEKAITQHTKAVIVVHLYGQCCDMDTILEICARRGIPCIEDAAQAIGSEWKGKRAGSMGALGCFSFFPSKNLGAMGDGGMVTAQDPALADKVRLLKEHGGRPKYYHSIIGTNSRLDALHAAVLRVKLRHLDSWSEGRARNAAIYNRLFEGSRVGTPHHDPRTRHIYNQYVIRVAHRDDVRKELTDRGIGTEIYYPVPFHLQKCFADHGHKEGDFPHAEAAARETVALPIYPELTEEQIGYVAAAVRELTGGR